MPKFIVTSSEQVHYEPVIVEAVDQETAEDILRQIDPRDLDAAHEEGDGFIVEAVEATEDEILHNRLLEVDDKGKAVPFVDPTIQHRRRAKIADLAREVLRALKNDDGDACLLATDDIEGAALDIAEKVVNMTR